MNPEPFPRPPRGDDLSALSRVPLSEREMRYRTLFGAMGEGFCVIEMFFDAEGKAVDYRFLEFNDAFERMTGITAEAALSGRTAREIYPSLEEFWFETYGRVATTGESVRFENRAEAMGKWFEVHAFRIGKEESREVGVLFKDATERREAEIERERLLREAQEREAFLALITDRLPVRVGYVDRDYRYQFLNGEYERQFGFAPGEANGRTVAEIAGESAFKIALPHLERALAGETHTEEFSVEYPFGERRVQVTYVSDRGSDGEVQGVVVQVLDATSRYEAERSLAQERERQDRTLENARVATFDWDVANDRVYANPLLARFFGVSQADAAGGPIERYFDAIHVDDREATTEAIGMSLRSGDPYETQYRLIDGDRRERWVLARGDTMLGADGKPLRLSGVVLDVTERIRADEARRASERQVRATFDILQGIIEGTSEVMVAIDCDFRFTTMNEAFRNAIRHLFGRTPEIGGNLLEVLTNVPEDYENAKAFWQRALAGEEVAEREQFGDPEHGRSVFDLRFYPIRDASGAIVGAAEIARDITERAEAEAERDRLLESETRARQAISQREELFRTVFEQAPDDAIVVMDANRVITAWNPAAERICGWTAEEAIGQAADLIFTPEDRANDAPLSETVEAARKGKAEDERWHMRKDGSRFWGSGTMNSLHGDGAVRGYLKVFRDATERYEETQTLAFLSLLTEAVIDQRGPDEILETVERMLGRYLGASRVTFGEFAEDEETFVVRQEWGADVPSVLGTYRLSDFGVEAKETIRTGKTYVVRDVVAEVLEPSVVRVSETIDVSASVSVPVMKGGRLVALFIVHDRNARAWTDDEISLVQQVADRVSSEIERARAEAALRASEARFRQLVELSPATVWFAEVDGGLSFISQDFYDVTGLTPEGALPHGWSSVVHPEDLARVQASWSEARRTERTYDTEFRIRHQDGEYRWISVRALPIRDAEERVTGWLGSNSDIQSQKETEGTLKAMVDARTEELQKAVQEAEGFNYSISHDLRTPLRAMVATSSILLEEAGSELSEEHRTLLVRQAENANRMGRLIDELLRLSRLARVEVRRERLDMTAAARSVFEELAQHDETNGCGIEVQVGMLAQGDANLVRTVLHNLLGNACKFSPAGGTIRVRQEGGVFSVADEGVGFDMRFAPKIFLPFERLVSEAEFPGTGIGLANVKRIVERHGGKVWVESEPGKGTTFRFTLE